MSNTVITILIASGIALILLVGLYILEVANKDWNDLHK